ncbi:Maternal protein pumilio [Strongyloides ratti]|uniref:Maternal protein pumilio n=1 Tax=Strongyloides ratti TaxID=34506 RepID=A0A090L447_STRRB|nr:Maternal protein pumilio [Strongyloides ratti]CEF62214.1 Maternal protein pumilio [Strongyloides ratti]
MVIPQEKNKLSNIGSFHSEHYSALPKSSLSFGNYKSLPNAKETFFLDQRKTIELTEHEKNFVRSLSCNMGGGDRSTLPGSSKFIPSLGERNGHYHHHDFPSSGAQQFYQQQNHQSSFHSPTTLPGSIFSPVPTCYYSNGCMGPLIPGYHLPSYHSNNELGGMKYGNVLDTILPSNTISSSVMDILTPPPEKHIIDEVPTNGGSLYRLSKQCMSSNNNNSNSRHSNVNSKLLEEFRNGRTHNLDLVAIRDDIFAFATDQHGSRFIQQKFDSATSNVRSIVFEAILPHTYNLMKDVFGNYIVQKFFESGDKHQRSQLLDMVRGHLVELSLDVYGCRVIQKAVENAEECDVQMILNELRVGNKIIKCMVDQHGNHVIQKVFENVKPESLNFIIDAVRSCGDDLPIVTLAKHNYGCRVLQKMLKHLLHHQKEFIIQELQSHLDELLTHQYGNYVIQELFNSSSTVVKHYIVIFIKADLEKYSMDKFASNVIEKCLTLGDKEQVKTLVTKIFEVPFEDLLYRMISDQFGNYVIQKMLDVCDGQSRKKLIAAIKPKQSFLKKVAFGKHILVKCNDNQLQPLSPQSFKSKETNS